MTLHQIEVRAIEEQYDVQAQQVAREIMQLPGKYLPSLAAITTSTFPLTIRSSQLYYLVGELSSTQIDQLGRQLFIDPVTQEAELSQKSEISNTAHIVDIFFHPGVTDTLAESVLTGAAMLGITTLERVETGRRYLLDKRLREADVRYITEALLYNPVIQTYTLHDSIQADFPNPAPIQVFNTPNWTSAGADLSGPWPIYRPGWMFHPTFIPLLDMSDQQLLELSKTNLLALNLAEMRTIQHHYQERHCDPTDVELETLAQTWSEHCSHKTFKATIHYKELDKNGKLLEQETINGLLKRYIMRATQQIGRSWVVSAFSDNAGIIRFTESQDIAFKVETHNHPSAIEPFGGANTGVGGVIRDVLGVSAQPIACTDILCFGPPELSIDDLPSGILSPHRIASGVVNGVRDYGNKMGIPTVNGAILYHRGYIYNPLVFCGCLGILPHGSHPRQARSGDKIVALGGRTGRDGIHGATFSSGEMSSEINARAGSAVQIGAPITEKKVADVIIQARAHQLYSAITDCGAGGFSSAIGEMGAETGAYVELAKAPLKYQGLAPWEIWLSEAQERMILAVPPEKLAALLEICAIEEVEASIIGTFTSDNRLTISYYEQIVADLDLTFLHDGRPDRTLEAVWIKNDPERPQESPQHITDKGASQNIHVRATLAVARSNLDPSKLAQPTATQSPSSQSIHVPTPFAPSNITFSSSAAVSPTYTTTLLSLLNHPTISSKESVVRRYDHEVQGATILKPMVGRAGNGPGDAAVLQPIIDGEAQLIAPIQSTGIIVSNGINPLYGEIDPYYMAINAVDEALRNMVAVGGDIERAALLDNFCWGNPNDPVQLGLLVRAVKGCFDAATGFGTPFISGKDSLNNEYRSDGERLPVIPTLLISSVGVIDDAAQTIDMSLKHSGNWLYQIGITRNELAGSHFAEVLGHHLTSLETDESGYKYRRGVPLRSPWEGTGEAYLSGSTVPHVDIETARITMKALGSAIREGLVQACHDLSEGGLAVAAAEMSLAGLLGISIDVGVIPLADDMLKDAGSRQILNIIRLFSESSSRFLAEVAPEHRDAFEAYMQLNGVQNLACVGEVNNTERFVIQNADQVLIDCSVGELQDAWKGAHA